MGNVRRPTLQQFAMEADEVDEGSSRPVGPWVEVFRRPSAWRDPKVSMESVYI